MLLELELDSGGAELNSKSSVYDEQRAWSWTCSWDHELELDLGVFQLDCRCTDLQLELSLDKSGLWHTPTISWKHNTEVLVAILSNRILTHPSRWSWKGSCS